MVYNLSFSLEFFFLFFCFSTFLIIFFPSRIPLIKSILLYSCFIFIGALCYHNFYKTSPQHFEHFLPQGDTLALQLEIKKHNSSNAFSHSYYADVIASNTKILKGKVWVYQKRNDATPPLEASSVIMARGVLKEIIPPKNPGAFNFKQFLAHQNIKHQFTVETYIPLSQKNKRSFWVETLLNAKKFIRKQLSNSGLSVKSQQMIQTMLMGERNAIEKPLKQAYAEAGVIHLLAISGLHIGILTFFFAAFLHPLKKLPWGNVIRGFILLVLLWSFVLFSGASASVVRAATMFSMLVIAQAFNRSQNSFHFLVLSFFLLLCIHPPYLHQIGFQMSYTAVFGILWIYPLFKKAYYPHSFLFRKLVDALYVCLAAQLTVTPLSIYYFHQFPGLFLLSNLVIVPLFGLFLIGSLGTLIYCIFSNLPRLWISTYNSLIDQLNRFVVFIAKQDQFLFKEIPLDWMELMAWYFILLMGIFFLKTLKPKYLFCITFGFLLFQLYGLKKDIDTQKQAFFWVLHKNQQVVISHQKGQTAYFYVDAEINQIAQLLEDFKRSQNSVEAIYLPLQNLYQIKTLSLLCIGKETTMVPLPKKPSHLLLTHNAKIHLKRWLDYYQPQLVIADGSNAIWQIARWKKTCLARGIAFHATIEKGACKISL